MFSLTIKKNGRHTVSILNMFQQPSTKLILWGSVVVALQSVSISAACQVYRGIIHPLMSKMQNKSVVVVNTRAKFGFGSGRPLAQLFPIALDRLWAFESPAEPPN